MNSYPPELLAQLAPVMFVAGLDAGPSTQPLSPTSAKGNDFGLLASRLREALQAQRKVAIWQPEKAKTFQVILVDKDIRFPPRKLVPPEDPTYSAAHSPLSPLTPSSPLHPDGLIAPIWIRKHTYLVPSVFVMFLRIYEFPASGATSPLDAPDANREREKEMEERKKDTELAAEVAQRKKGTNERGIKLTVVLMASRKMLDDPTLDTRLTFIRRQSGLDSRAALFVLSPVSQAELGEFVKSLQQALYEPALEYYTAHSKRVRRKRNRHSQANYINPVTGSTNIARPLRPEGWTVRYEYKMACFAEFRGEDEVALKHYQDAHSMLVVMFGSTAILPPRTKRWAEAKVLADCISLKIVKLYLYNNEHALALSHHNSHVRIFNDFSRGWGIGEETFEYWSWLARQHRVLAELLEQGTRSTLTIPVHRPVTSANTNLAASLHNGSARAPPGMLETETIRSLGINPSHALQHSGFYYFMAAKCTETRRERFLAALEIEVSPTPTEGFPLSPDCRASEFAESSHVVTWLCERKESRPLDHYLRITLTSFALQLYTKAYELFKKHTVVDPQNPTQSRLTLWIAYRIAQTYYDSTKYDMAIRFFERIATIYRRENWDALLQPLLSTWYACARELGDIELSIKLLIEMLGHHIIVNPTTDAANAEESNSVEEDLLAILKISKSTVPSSDEPLVVDLSESQPICELWPRVQFFAHLMLDSVDHNVVFWTPEANIGQPGAFQLSLVAPKGICISSLPISTLSIHFSHRQSPLIIRHQHAEDATPSSYKLINLGHISTSSEQPEDMTANLRWEMGDCFILFGSVSSDSPTTIKIDKLVLTLEEEKWTIKIPIVLSAPRRHTSNPKWLTSVNPPQFLPMKREASFLDVRHRSHNLAISLAHESPAYLNEEYPITIEITNIDDRPFDVVVNVLIPPTEIDGAVNTIILGDERSSNFIKGVPFGVISPGDNAVKTLYLANSGAAGDRVVDISVQSRATDSVVDPAEPELDDMTETTRMLVVPTVDPLRFVQTISYRRGLDPWPGLADLNTFDGDRWNPIRTSEALVNTRIECAGPSSLQVESITFERQEHERAKFIECSADSAGASPSEYYPGDEISHVCRLALASPEDDDDETLVPSSGNYRIMWRRLQKDGTFGSLSSTTISLPALQPPIEGLVALLSIPSPATLHVPIPLSLTIRNYHPSRSANVVVTLELDASDGFIVAGLRNGRLPILMPGDEEKFTWKLIPIECGHVKLPHIKVVDKRPIFTGGTEPTADMVTKGEMVKIVDVRLAPPLLPSSGQPAPNLQGEIGTVLVLP
ncbi:hypothetical protein DXG01_010100 [Tephrocybe rancida]|nr:hypothetical protein DXG01_010100 [Tephrocybe rancida]